MAAEKNFENKVKKFLSDNYAWYIKYWGGAKYTKSGVPDILACVRGSFIGIELKAHNGRPDILQLICLGKIRSAGGYGVLLYPDSFEDFKQFCEEPNRLNPWYIENIALQYQWFEKLNK